MAICVYDNPSTMARECWDNGRLICHYQAQLFFSELPIPAEHFFFGANIGPFIGGQIVGDKKAINEDDL